MRPNVYASSTTGVKKSVVRTSPWPPGIRTTAASSPSSRPTMSSAAGAAGPVAVSPATTASSSPGGILHAHPPPWAYWVSRMVAGALVTVAESRRGCRRPPRLLPSAGEHHQCPTGDRGVGTAAAPPTGGMGLGRGAEEAGIAPRRGLGGQLDGLDAVPPEPAWGLPFPAPRHQVPPVGRAGQQLRFHLPPRQQPLGVAVVEHQHTALRQPSLDDRAQDRGASGLGADDLAAGAQCAPPAWIGLEGGENLVQRGAAVCG